VERLWSLHDLGEFIECQFLQLQEWLEVMGPGTLSLFGIKCHLTNCDFGKRSIQ